MRPEFKWRRTIAFCRIFGSLNRAITHAGGVFMKIDKLNWLSAFDLLETLGCNNIYFKWKKDSKKEIEEIREIFNSISCLSDEGPEFIRTIELIKMMGREAGQGFDLCNKLLDRIDAE